MKYHFIDTNYMCELLTYYVSEHLALATASVFSV